MRKGRRSGWVRVAATSAVAFVCLPATAGAVTISSAFAAGAEGWTIAGPFGDEAPVWTSAGGNPAGYLRSTGGDVRWHAPATFLGNRAALYGGVLRFDSQAAPGTTDVVLQGAGTEVRLPVHARPVTGWQRQEVRLVAPGDEPRLRSVLTALTRLTIQAGAIDNVKLTSVLAPPAITSPAGVVLKTGMPASFVVKTSGTPYPALTIAGELPAGLTFTDNLDGTATLAGTPVEAGTRTVTIRAASPVGTVTQALSVEVGAPPKLTSPNRATFRAGDENEFTVTTTGTPAAAVAETRPLPDGVDFTDHGDGTATLGGTPEVAGQYALQMRAQNAAGTGTQGFTLTVTAPPPEVLASLSPYAARAAYGGFDQTFPVTAGGPWDAVACVNNGYSLTNGAVDAASGLPGDGVSAGRFEVRQGDRGNSAGGGDRCEIGLRNRKLLGERAYALTDTPPDQGDLRFYHLSFGVGEDFPEENGYTTFAQLHQPSTPGSSPLSVETLGDRAEYTIVVLRQVVNGVARRPQALVQFPTPRGRWADLVVELNLSQRPDLGYVRVWLDGRRVDEASSPNGAVDGVDDDTFRGATMYSSYRGDVDWAMDFKVGNYRSAAITAPSAVYHRLTKLTTTLQAAQESPVPVAPPPRVSCSVGNLPQGPAVGQVYRPVLRLTNDAPDVAGGTPVSVHARVETMDASGAPSGVSERVLTLAAPAKGAGVTYDLPSYSVPATTPEAAFIRISAVAQHPALTCSSRRIVLPAAAPSP